MDKNWVRERGRRARRRRCWWGGGRRTVARAGRVSVFLVLSCWWGPRHSPAEQRRGARDKRLICGGAHSYSHLYCQCVAVTLIILVSLDYHIHVTFYLGNDGVMTRWAMQVYTYQPVRTGYSPLSLCVSKLIIEGHSSDGGLRKI